MAPLQNVNPADAFAVQALGFEWAMSADTKDFQRLENILAPRITLDYTNIMGKIFDNITPDEWLAIQSSSQMLGSPLLSTQHFLGAARYVQESESRITAHCQIRAAHIRWKDESKKEEIAKGHGHGELVLYAEKIDGEWKLVGWKPTVFWNEHDFEAVFRFDET